MGTYLIAAWGTRGDVQPAIAVARGLHDRNHEVVVAAPVGAADDTREAGLRFEPLGDDPLSWFDEDPSRHRIDPVRVGRAFFALFRAQVDAQFDALVPMSEGVDAVIGQGMMYGAASAAEQREVPYHYLCPNPFMLPSAWHPPIGVPFARLPRWANRLAWQQFALLYRLGFRRLINGRRHALDLPTIGSAHAHVFDATRAVLCFDPELYPPPPDWRHGREPLGALHAPGEPALDEKTERFLQGGAPPIYVGFGSMTDPDPSATTRLVVDAARTADRRIILSRGWADLGSALEDEPDVLVIESVPHAALFPRVAVVVHHGGVGTASAAARAGTPQVVVPHAYDQHASGAKLVRAGVAAASIPRRRMTATALTAALEAGRDERVIRRAREVGDAIRRRDPLAAVCDLIEESATTR